MGFILSHPVILYIIAIYVVGLVTQAVISSICLRYRSRVLMSDYGYNEKRLKKLFITSIFLWPVSMWYGIKAFFVNGITKYNERRKAEREEEEIDMDEWDS